MTENYKPDDSNPLHSALLWPGGHKNLPPHLIQCCGLDPLRDDSLIYDKVLKDAGVPVQTIVYTGVPHGFDGMFSQIGLAQKFVKDRSEWLTSVLSK